MKYPHALAITLDLKRRPPRVEADHSFWSPLFEGSSDKSSACCTVGHRRSHPPVVASWPGAAVWHAFSGLTRPLAETCPTRKPGRRLPLSLRFRRGRREAPSARCSRVSNRWGTAHGSQSHEASMFDRSFRKDRSKSVDCLGSASATNRTRTPPGPTPRGMGCHSSNERVALLELESTSCPLQAWSAAYFPGSASYRARCSANRCGGRSERRRAPAEADRHMNLAQSAVRAQRRCSTCSSPARGTMPLTASGRGSISCRWLLPPKTIVILFPREHCSTSSA